MPTTTKPLRRSHPATSYKLLDGQSTHGEIVSGTMEAVPVEGDGFRTRSGVQPVFAREIVRFLRWVKVFEGVSRARPMGLSRWYRGNVLAAYCRSGTPGARLRGGKALCFANIEVSPAYRGRGLFTLLIEAVSSEPDLVFDRIEIQEVQNARFATWLERNGFQKNGRAGPPDGVAHSFSRP